MKELERTKRISISAVLFVLVLLIGFLTFERPQYIFQNSAENTIEKIAKGDYIISLEAMKKLDPKSYFLVDIRNHYDYTNGHIDGAINISSHNLFDQNVQEFTRKYKNTDARIILYGKDPDDALTFWMLLYQLGYSNVSILAIQTGLVNNQFTVKDITIEKPEVDYAAVMKKATSTSNTAGEQKQPKKPKKVITVKKKKKRTPEGGC